MVIESNQHHFIPVDSASQWQDHLDRWVQEKHSIGYLSYSINSVDSQHDTVKVLASEGPLFHLEQDDRHRTLHQQTTQLEVIGKEQIKHFENHGYPFASVSFRPEIANDSTIRIDPIVHAGVYVSVDSLIMKSDHSFHPKVMAQHLNWSRGAPYSESVFRKIDRRLRDLPYVQVRQASQVIFKNDRADLYIFIEDKKANSFDGIIGFQPEAETGRVVFTGDVTLELHNALRRGEQLSLRWRRLQASTQDLQIKSALPYLFNSHLGLWAGIEVYRRDSSFTQTSLDLAAGWVLGSDKYFRAFTERFTSNDLQNTSTSIDDVRVDRYGLAFQYFELDDRGNPMAGYFISSEVSAGLREVTSDSEEANTFRNEQYTFQLRSNFYLPLAQNFSLEFRADAATRVDTTLRLNENYRIGGLSTIRGFDEESIFARSFAIGSVSVKYRFDGQSAVYLFYDQGWYERMNKDLMSDTPFGFGAGMQIGTKNGSFKLAYALGSEQDNPILLRNGKVHFGFINRF